MHEIEVKARSLEEARKIAAFQLGVSEDRIELEVIQEAKPSVLGGLLGGGMMRVRARIRDDAFSPRAEEGEEAAAAEEEDIDLSRYSLAGQETAVEEAEEEYDEYDEFAQVSEQVREIAGRACEFLRGLLARMGIEAEAAVRSMREGEIEIEVTGKDLGLLIGRHGQTLDAVQYITAVAANKGYTPGARVIVDAEGYRQRRRQSLERLARSTAAKVKRTGQRIALGSLKAYERRIIHLTLRDDPDVETYSEGEGANRRVIIAPRRNRGGR